MFGFVILWAVNWCWFCWLFLVLRFVGFVGLGFGFVNLVYFGFWFVVYLMVYEFACGCLGLV